MSSFQQKTVDYSTLEVVGEPTVGATRDQYRPPVPPKPSRFATPPESDRTNTMSLSRENSLPQPSVPCCECNQSIKTWKCVQCDDFFCDVCWDKQRPHLPHKRGIDGRQHEKVDQEVIDRLTRIFGQRTREEQHRMHSNDINTTWFGVDKEANQPFLHYTNRLVDILQESQLGDSSERFPQLVSFVGQTGAGKSTVIKMLVNRAQAEQPSLRNAGEFPAPVPGLVGDNIPTTGDVHLYADPQTFYNPKPILYADCEGMTGGENTPRGLSSREMIETAKKPGHFMKNKIRKKLAWADNPKKQSREFAVTTMFPRILYTFSDVVVFVLREVRKFETDVLQLLIQWADISIDKSINQPSIPHIVIVVNATDTNIDEAQWDPEKATRGLLDDYKSSVHRVPALIEVLAGLKYRGKHIKTTEQLLEHFYSSVTVVRIPEKGRYMQIDTQVKKLYLLIQQLCASSYECKKRVRMLLNAERLPQYVNSAYDHFSKRLDAPFDFMAEARRHTPLPTDFGGHILNLILLLYNSDVRPALGRAKPLFKRLARPVASCVMLSAIMDNTQGSISSLLRDTYYEPLYSAFTEFCDHWLRCCYQQDGFQCCNARNSHKKGHQEARTGKILSKGDYQPVFDVEEFFPQWIDDIHKNIEYLNGRLQVLGREERSTILSLHQTEIESFYKNTGSASQFKSNLTCLCCVRKIPENVLPCGHVLCNHCIQAFGQDMGQGSFHLDCCPLHPHETAWPTPANIRFKPKEAGVRILSLDGGGVRGIIELVILEALEEALDGHIPIQNFFDLIVGTSTGGIIALGLGAKGWRVSTCMTQFKSLCLKAFTPRGPRAFKALNVVSRKSYYKTRPLEEALQSAFGSESLLYGEPKDGNSSPIRVAVTATLASDNRPAILTNYNTGGDRDTAQYKFVRPADKAAELKVWEAARATAAAPPYFKSFVHSSTLAAYTDGAIHHNCPVLVADNERGLLWEDNINWSPDIVLSLATGKSNAQASAHSKGIWSSDSRSKPSSETRGTAGLSYMWRTANAMLDSQLNCNNIWNKYKAKVTPLGAAKRIEDKQRYLRIDIPFNKPRPALDDVKQLDDMERHARNYIKGRPEIREAAQRLIASCFYFEKSGQDKGAGSFGCIFGNIRCRLREGSRDLKGLGKILRSYILGDNFVPFFYLQENFGTSDQRDHELPIGAEIIGKMCDLGLFKLPTSLRIDSVNQSGLSNICLRLQPRESHRDYHYDPNRGYLEFFPPLSGFPRELFASEGPLSPLIKEPDLEGEAEDGLPEIQDAPTGPSRTYSETGSPRQEGKVQRFLSLRTKPSSLYKSLSYLNMRGKAAAPGESSIRERHSMDAPVYGVPRLASSSISTLSTRDSRYSYETTDRSVETEDIYNDDHF